MGRRNSDGPCAVLTGRDQVGGAWGGLVDANFADQVSARRQRGHQRGIDLLQQRGLGRCHWILAQFRIDRRRSRAIDGAPNPKAQPGEIEDIHSGGCHWSRRLHCRIGQGLQAGPGRAVIAFLRHQGAGRARVGHLDRG